MERLTWARVQQEHSDFGKPNKLNPTGFESHTASASFPLEKFVWTRSLCCLQLLNLNVGISSTLVHDEAVQQIWDSSVTSVNLN